MEAIQMDLFAFAAMQTAAPAVEPKAPRKVFVPIMRDGTAVLFTE